MSTEEPAPCEDCSGNLAKHEKTCQWYEGPSDEELSALEQKTKALEERVEKAEGMNFNDALFEVCVETWKFD